MTLTDGSDVTVLFIFKVWAEDLLCWYEYIERNVYDPNIGDFVPKKIRVRLIHKQFIIVGRGGAKTLYESWLQAYGLTVDTSTTNQVTTAPTMKQAEEVTTPINTALTRAKGPLFQFLTEGSLQNTTGDRAKRQKLASTKKGIQNFLTNSILEIRPMTIDKLQGLRTKYNTIDEWLSGDTREDVVGPLEQGAKKILNWWIVAVSSEGTVRNGDDLLNMERGSKERISQLYQVAGSIRTAVDELQAGDIGATVKLKDTRTGNTLNAKECDNQYAPIVYPQPRYRRAIKPVTESDAEKLAALLTRMHEEDPTWVVEQSKELRQMIVSGQGEFHLRTLKWRLENNDKMMVEFLEPKIPYRETITKAARADYRHKKQSGGAGQFGEVHLIVEPYEEGVPVKETYKFGNQEYKISVKDQQEINLEWGGKLVIINSIVGGAIDARFIPAIVKGIMDRMEQGPLTGSYARDVRVIIYDGKMHPVDSNEISFRLAGRNAFAQAFKEANPKVLEPVYDLEVFVPSEIMGDVMSDINGRRGMVMGMETEKSFTRLKAQVPLKELSSYSTTLSSLTGGRATFTMAFNSYQLVPADVQEKLLAAYAASQTDEE